MRWAGLSIVISASPSEAAPSLFGVSELSPTLQRLAGQIGRVMKQEQDEARAIEAEIAELPPQEQLVARAQARLREESIAREKATLEAIYAIQSVAEASATAAEARAKESAERERHMADTADKLLTLTKLLLAASVATLLAAIVTLIVAS